mgnify:CR=1 FL=1
MCKVKSGKMLKNQQDIQNLVIGIINRQENIYNSEEIVNMVDYYCKDAQVDVDRKTLSNMVNDNLDYLYRKAFINCSNGNYYPQTILTEI